MRDAKIDEDKQAKKLANLKEARFGVMIDAVKHLYTEI